MITYSCFYDCKTTIEDGGSGKDSGQAYFIEGNNVACYFNVINECTKRANRNFDPFYILNAKAELKNENISNNKVFERGCARFNTCDFLMKYSHFYKNEVKDGAYPHFFATDSNGTFSYCNIIHINTGSLLFSGGKVDNCCISEFGSLKLGFINDGSNFLNGYIRQIDVLIISQKCNLMFSHEKVNISSTLKISFSLAIVFS